MEYNITEKLSLEDFHNKILNKLAEINNSLLKSINLTEEQYFRLINTPEGKEKIKKIIEKKPDIKIVFIRIETIRKLSDIVENEFTTYLPF